MFQPFDANRLTCWASKVGKQRRALANSASAVADSRRYNVAALRSYGLLRG
jgi:hypothetical protein